MTDYPRNARRRGRVPLDERSVIATAAGVPWWGAIVCAVTATVLGFAIDALTGDELTGVFTAMYVLGCVAAVLIVRNKAIFTAMVQPPLLLFVAVPLAYRSFIDGPSRGMKSLLFDMALPLINRFPTMMTTTVIVWVIGALRIALYLRSRRSAGGRTRATSPARSRTESGGNRRPQAPSAARAREGRRGSGAPPPPAAYPSHSDQQNRVPARVHSAAGTAGTDAVPGPRPHPVASPDLPASQPGRGT